MSLDIEFTQQKKRICPHCGKDLADPVVIDSAYSGGRVWYPFLESIGYYVPLLERTEDNDWYGKDMVLTKEQTEAAYRFVKQHEFYNKSMIAMLISSAIAEDDDVAVNANW